jgi:hypothetical protein
VTCPFVWDAAHVEERPLEHAGRAALDERRWQPAEGRGERSPSVTGWARRRLAATLPRS